MSKMRKMMRNGHPEDVREINLDDICTSIDEFHAMMHDLLMHPKVINERAAKIDEMAEKMGALYPNADLATMTLFIAAGMIHVVQTKRHE
jgi:hypothetical protein